MKRVWFLILGLVVILTPGDLTYAQDDPQDSETAQVERFLEAIRTWEEADNLSVEGARESTFTFEYNIPNQPGIAQIRTLNEEFTRISQRGDDEWSNIQYTNIFTDESLDMSTMNEFMYMMEAEVRYVDNVIYVNARYPEPDPNLLPLPDGWVRINNPVNWPIFAPLNLEALLIEETIERIWLADEDLFFESILSVEVLAPSDDLATETITIEFDLAYLLGEAFDTFFPSNWQYDEVDTIEQIEENGGTLVRTVGFNENGEVILQRGVASINFVGVDYFAFTGETNAPANTTMSYSVVQTNEEIMISINDPDLPDIEAPTIGG